VAKVSKEWDRILKILPGYDPFEQSEGYVFDAEEAQLRIDFVEAACTHIKGKLAGTPIKLEDWQKSLHANMFGWKKPSGERRYREVFVYVPRGNAKTTNAATIVLSCMCLDNEPGAECYSAAAEREQARLCFECVEGMIKNRPELEKRFNIFKYSITRGDNSYKAISAEAKSKHGFNAHLVVNDELHAHKDGELTETLMTSTLKRSQPLVVHLTTADFDRVSICNSKYDYACKVRDGMILDPAFLPIIYEASEEDDWEDEATWEKANPNWPVMDHDYFRRECKRAVSDPAYRNTFKRLHLDMKTSSNVSAFDMVHWDDCDERNPVDSVKGKPCYASLDVSSKSDLTALIIEVPYYKDDSDEISIESVDIFSWFWVPEEAVSRRSREKSLFATYSGWAELEQLFIQPGQRIDQDVIRAFINQLRDEGWNIQSIGYDPWNAEAIRQGLEADGFEMIEFMQTIKNFSEPFKDLVSLVAEHKVRHGMQPVLRWNASNCVAYSDPNGNIRPDKKNSIDKIDGIVGMIMAHAVAMQEHVEESGGMILL
jgi:phage terminase large subunit-like protein